MSIRKKLFLSILAILTANFLLLTLLGTTLFQTLYEQNKVRELKRTAAQLKTNYQQDTQQSWEQLFQQIFTAENRNSEVVIFRLQEEQQPEIVYHSRMRASVALRIERLPGSVDIQRPPESPESKRYQVAQETPGSETIPAAEIISITQPPFMPFIQPEVMAQLPHMEEDQMLSNLSYLHKRGDAVTKLSLLSRLDDNLYLMLDSPREYIASTADMAVKYSAGLSIVVLLAGALVIYYLSGRFTRPIREMEQVAQQIAQLDFSASCPAKGGDELGALGASINHMSGQLQSSLDSLMDANRLLQRDLERQQETDRMRRQFISDVSHDFKTPLALMVSYAEAIRDQKNPAQTESFCNIIADECNRLSAMVGRLLKLSRLESGMDALEESVFPLGQLLEDTANTLRLPAQQKSLTLAVACDSGLVVRGDYQKIGLVVLNLVENAVKYAPNGASICLSAQAAGKLCSIVVENTGSHIDESRLEEVFTSFYRADPARERQEQGYGLGLAIVRTILELHGQQCTAENTLDGVRFFFALPLVEMDDED